MVDSPRMGLGAVLAALLDTHLGRRSIEHLHAASHTDNRAERRNHLRIAVRLARKALARMNGKR